MSDEILENFRQLTEIDRSWLMFFCMGFTGILLGTGGVYINSEILLFNPGSIIALSLATAYLVEASLVTAFAQNKEKPWWTSIVMTILIVIIAVYGTNTDLSIAQPIIAFSTSIWFAIVVFYAYIKPAESIPEKISAWVLFGFVVLFILIILYLIIQTVHTALFLFFFSILSVSGLFFLGEAARNSKKGT